MKKVMQIRNYREGLVVQASFWLAAILVGAVGFISPSSSHGSKISTRRSFRLTRSSVFSSHLWES